MYTLLKVNVYIYYLCELNCTIATYHIQSNTANYVEEYTLAHILPIYTNHKLSIPPYSIYCTISSNTHCYIYIYMYTVIYDYYTV